jgi:hypothetical protein
MKPEELLQDFAKQLKQLKLLMASFSPDSRLAELIKQATIEAHHEGELTKKLTTCQILLYIIAILTFIFGTGGIILLLYLAK